MGRPQFDLSAELNKLSNDSRVAVRRQGDPDPNGRCVVYWMQRAQRGIDSHAVDLAVKVANLLGLPLVVYFAGISNFPHANLRHYVFQCRRMEVTR
jgi:deoxyribodipyrimidine photo-lyase